MPSHPKNVWRARGPIAWIAGFIAILLAVGGLAAPATAATPGALTLSLAPTGETYDGVSVVTPGKNFTLGVQYDPKKLVPGEEIIISIPEGVEIPDAALVLPGTVTVFEKVVRQSDGTLKVTVSKPLPSGIDQGVWSLDFRITEVEGSVKRDLTWEIDGAATSLTVVVKKPGDEFENVNNGRSKSIDWNTSLSRFVTVTNGVVAVSDDVLSVDLPFVINVDTTTAKSSLTITDTIDSRLTVSPTATSKLTTWDANGLNRTTAASSVTLNTSATGFTTAVDLPADSRYQLNYTARITDAAALALIVAELQAAHDKVAAAGGGFSAALKNSVTWSDGAPASATSYSLGATAPAPAQPNYGAAFGKSVDVTSVPGAELAGTDLVTPVAVAYALTADLRLWDEFAGTAFALNRNVVVRDQLPGNSSWNTVAADFITAVDQDGAPVALKKATGLTGDIAAAIAADAHVGSYFVSGQTLFVNLGTDVTKKYTVTAKASITNVTGVWANTQNPLATTYGVTNNASFTYRDGASQSKGTTTTISVPTDTTGGVEDKNTFEKSSPATVQVNAAPAVTTVPYAFTIGAGKVDMSELQIIDAVDTNVFDISDLAAIEKAVTVKYENYGVNTIGWWPTVTLDDSHWHLQINGDGELVFTFSDAFDAVLKAAGVSTDRQVVVTLPLPLKTVIGKQSLEIDNTARLMGAKSGLEYSSTRSSQATSYGDELEVRKTVYDRHTDKFTNNLRVEIDENGQLVDDEFYYRIQAIPHGKYGAVGVKITDVVDILPSDVAFVGFADLAGVASDTVLIGDTVTLPGNLHAVMETSDDGREIVSIRQRPGTTLNSTSPIIVYVKVKAGDIAEGVGVTNSIGDSSATFTPTNAFPLSIQKLDASDAKTVITDTNARFQLLDAAGDVAVDNIYVVDNQLVVAGATAGEHKTLSVKRTGVYTIVEVKAPAGYVLSAETKTVTVDAEGNSAQIKLFNERGTTPEPEPEPEDPKKVSVGDFVWVDSDRDGVQDAGEPGIAGVKLVLTDADGNAVVDVDGQPVGPVVTDAQGSYTFENLPAGVIYTVTIDQKDAGTVAALAPYVATVAGAGSDRGTDSSTWTATSVSLPNDGDRDPTLDFGFVTKTYAIGDFTWIDANRDGIQDADEQILAGVGVELLDADGNVVAETVTDTAGRYLFDALAAGTYQVRFTLTPDQAELYDFTVSGAGSATDSDGVVGDNPAVATTATITLDDTNTSLTTSYDKVLTATQGVDPTWDAGVVLKLVIPEPQPTIKKVSVGDFVWVDTDRDGVQDDGEPGIAGVKLVLTDADGNAVIDVNGEPVTPVVTDSKGAYSFENLPAGASYIVSIDRADVDTLEALAPYVPTTAGAGDNRALDSSTWTATSVVLPNDGDRDPTLDFGFVAKTYAIGDIVWIDVNRDGIQDFDLGELPLSGVTVTLVHADGTPVDGVEPQVTTKDGRYLFDNLPAGEYRVQFALTDDQKKVFEFTTRHSGVGSEDDSLFDSDAKADGETGVIVLGAGNPALTHDYDRTVAASEGVDPTWDAGVIRKKVSLGDYVWVDANRDGLQGETEQGIAGVKLVLTGPDGEQVRDVFGNLVEPVVTDEKGAYLFEHLPAGVIYTVTIDQDDAGTQVALAPYLPTTAGAGDDRARDSSTWEAISRALPNDGDHDPTLDFGFIAKTYAIGDVVWIDANKDGLQDDTEQVLPGVKVELLDADGVVVATTTSNDHGRYLFDELAAGTYAVRFTLTAEQAKVYAFTVADQGDVDGLDSDAVAADADAISATTGAIVLGATNTALTRDYAFGEVRASEGIDPTWDAGVIVRALPGDGTDKPGVEQPGTDEGTDPALPGTPTVKAIPSTGGTLAIGALWGGFLLIALGAWAVVTRRRHTA